MKKTILLTLAVLGVFWGGTSSFGASSVEVKVASDGNVAVTTDQGASAQFAPSDGSAPTEIASLSTFSTETGAVVAVDPSNSFAGVSNSNNGDARSESGRSIAATSAQPSSGGPGDVDTAAGGEGPSDVATAAGGGGSPDTQPPLSPAGLPPITSPPTTGLTTPI